MLKDHKMINIPKELYENRIDSFDKLLWLIENAYDGLVLADKKGNIFYANRAVFRITGANKEDLYGKNLKDFVREGLIINDKKNIAPNVINMSHRTVTGVEVFITSVPVYDVDGNFLCYIANYREMAELEDIRRELEETQAKKEHYYNELKELRTKFLTIEDFVVKSKSMQNILEQISKFAPTDAPVLITGESGVGKGVVAKLIHNMSRRKHGPFIQINCGAIPEHLLEAELFGYKPGAFTGASKKGKIGLFGLAQDGTLLLDEIGELPLNLQVKLLKALQDKEIYPLGATEPIKLDVRIICATNRNIEQMVKDGLFRKDLYYRINVIPLHIPPLKKRQEDIVPLACYFLDKYCKKYNKRKSLSPDACKLLLRYQWPGNVRELENIMERAVITVDKDKITALELSEFLSIDHDEKYLQFMGLSLTEAKDRLEQKIIKNTLDQSKSIRDAARKLGINHSTLIKKIKKYNLR